jgi:hypothetical protein
MYVDCDRLEVGIVVNLKTLRETLRGLSINGRRWWIACDPHDAAARGYVSVGYGDPQCEDRLNTVYFRFPIVEDVTPKISADTLVLMIDPSTCTPEAPGFLFRRWTGGARFVGGLPLFLPAPQTCFDSPVADRDVMESESKSAPSNFGINREY